MLRRAALLAALPLVWLSSAAVTPAVGAAGDGVVRAVLFVSPTCPHCRKVREEVLPPLWKRFEGRFQVGVVSTTTQSGRDLYFAAVRRYGVQTRGVPLLVIGDFTLVGSEEIPRRLPGLISSYLASGGADWPPIPGLDTLLAASVPPPTPVPTPAPTPVATPTPTPEAPVQPTVAGAAAPEAAAPQPPPLPEPKPAAAPPVPPEAKAPAAADAAAVAAKADADATPPRPLPAAAGPRAKPTPSPTPAAPDSLDRGAAVAAAAPPMLITAGADEERHGVVARVLTDPQGNGLAILVLVAMIATVGRSIVALRRPARANGTRPLDWLTPLLALAGLGVASYLAHVEVRGVEAVCGPVGDCNTVQQSEYARLFGVVPIGVLGVAGFAAILVAWGVRRWGVGRGSSLAAVALLAMTGFGVLFSIYLTFLEPFVIGATCLWCLSSAVIMTTLYLLAHAPGRAAVAELDGRRSSDVERRTT